MTAPPPVVDGQHDRAIGGLRPIARPPHEVRALVWPNQAKAGYRLAGHRLAADPVRLLGRREAAEQAIITRLAVPKRQEKELANEAAAACRARFDGERTAATASVATAVAKVAIA